MTTRDYKTTRDILTEGLSGLEIKELIGVLLDLRKKLPGGLFK